MRHEPVTLAVRVNDASLHRPKPFEPFHKDFAEEVIEGHKFQVEVHERRQASTAIGKAKEFYMSFTRALLYEDPDGAYSIHFVGQYENLIRLRHTIPVMIKAINDMGVLYWQRRAAVTGWYEVGVEVNQVPVVCDRSDMFFFACSEYERAQKYRGWNVLSYDRLHAYHQGMGEKFRKFVEEQNMIAGYDDALNYYYCFKDWTVESLVKIFKLSWIIDMYEKAAAEEIGLFQDKVFARTEKLIYDDVAKERL